MGHERCEAGLAAQAVLDGANNRPWDSADTLATTADWVAAYEVQNLMTTVSEDAQVKLVIDETMTAVTMPHALTAWVCDHIGTQIPTMAPPADRLAATDWVFLVTGEPIPAEVPDVLDRIGVRILEPGHRLQLPTTTQPQATQGMWWYQWPRRHVSYPDLFGAPPLGDLLNHAFSAARDVHWLDRYYKRETRFEVRTDTHITIALDKTAARVLFSRAKSRPWNKVGSELIAVGARVLDAAGHDSTVRVRTLDGAETVVDIDDALAIGVAGRWPAEYETHGQGARYQVDPAHIRRRTDTG